MNGLSRWRLIIYLLAIFAAGSVSGWVFGVKTTTEKNFREFRLEEFADKYKRCLGPLELTEDQRKKIDVIVDRTCDQMKTVHGQHLKEIGDVMSSRNQEISKILNQEQKQKFEEIERERQEEIRKKFRSRGSRDRDRSRGDSKEKKDQSSNCRKSNHNS